jgi:hypothetical protein
MGRSFQTSTERRSPKMSRLFLAVTCFLLALGTARGSRADAPLTGAEASARVAFADGLRLRDVEHKPQEALQKFKIAHALAATTRTTYELGKTLLVLGQLVDAQRAFAEVDQLPPDPLQTPEGKAAREDAARLKADLEGRIPTISVHVIGASRGEHSHVTIDGTELSDQSLDSPVKVDPGPHTVVSRAGWNSGEDNRSLTVAEGAHEEVTFDVRAGGTAGGFGGRQVLAVTAAAAGALFTIAGGIFALQAMSAKSDSDQHCGAAVGGADPNQCDASGVSSRQDAGSKADTATVLFVLGGAGLAVGAVLWFTAPKREGDKPPSAGVSAALTPAGVLLRGAF